MKNPESEPRVVLIRGELADAVHAIAATERLLARPERLSEEALLQASELSEGALDLARGVVLRGLEMQEAPSAAELRASAGAQLEALRDLAGTDAPSLVPATLEAVGDEHLEEVGMVLREAAHEFAEHDTVLGTHAADGLVLVAAPETPAQAYVGVMGDMYGRIEGWVLADELLALERTAARWWFAQLTPPGRAEEHDFARGVREREFALADRPFLGLDDRTAVEYMADAGELDDFPPKQRHLAMQLRRSVAGIWEVTERDGDETVLRAPLDGARLRVVEHAPHQPYTVGMIAIGRLIPFGEGTWLRSPGMLLASAPASGGFQAIATGLAEGSDTFPMAARLETMITTLSSRAPIPRRVLPAPGVREAAEVLQRVLEVLREAGLDEDVPPDEVPPELAPGRVPGAAAVLGFSLDFVMLEWIAALHELARKGETRRKRKEGAKGKKRRGRGGRR